MGLESSGSLEGFYTYCYAFTVIGFAGLFYFNQLKGRSYRRRNGKPDGYQVTVEDMSTITAEDVKDQWLHENGDHIVELSNNIKNVTTEWLYRQSEITHELIRSQLLVTLNRLAVSDFVSRCSHLKEKYYMIISEYLQYEEIREKLVRDGYDLIPRNGMICARVKISQSDGGSGKLKKCKVKGTTCYRTDWGLYRTRGKIKENQTYDITVHGKEKVKDRIIYRSMVAKCVDGSYDLYWVDEEVILAKELTRLFRELLSEIDNSKQRFVNLCNNNISRDEDRWKPRTDHEPM